MIYTSVTPLSVSTNVWTYVVGARKLTSLGGALTATTTVNASLAAGANINFTPAASIVRDVTLGLKAGAAGTVVARWSDATNFFTSTTVLAGQTGMLFSAKATSTFFLNIINNDGANAATYSYIFVDTNVA